MPRTFCILFLFCLHTIAASSQSRGFISYSVQDGLAQSNVTDITEDQWGNLWLATSGGLCKFNGLEFTTYNKQNGLPSNQIYCLTLDTEGNIWLGTNVGISRYDGHSFTNYPVESLQEGHLINNILTNDQGDVWFSSTAGHLFHLNDTSALSGEVTLEKSFGSKISGLGIVNSTMWVASYRSGIYQYQDGKFQQVPLDQEHSDIRITSMYIDNANIPWFGTNGELFKYENDDMVFVHSFHSPSKDFEIFAISEEERGVMWVGTTNGAFRYFEGTCTPVNASDGLTDNIIYEIHKDREGTLWFGSFGNGFHKSLGDLFTRLDKRQGLGYDYISTIDKDPNAGYWFGSYGGGAYHYVPASGPERPLQIKNYGQDQGLSNDFVYDISYDQAGDLWIATAFGLNKYQQGKLVSYYREDGLPSNQVFSLLRCKDGSFYCGTGNGLVSIDPSTGSFQKFNHKGGADHNRVRTLIESNDGTLLLGTRGGLKVFDGQSIENYFSIDSLSNWPVSTVYEDPRGGLWCALFDDGILYFDPPSGVIRHFTAEQGLSSDIVYSLTMDKFGSLWVGTPNGLDKIDFDTTGSIEQVRNFGASEGFFGIEANTNAVLTETDGSIWFGTVEGVFRCNPSKDRLNPLEPVTYITGIRLFSELVDWDAKGDSTDGWHNLPVNLTLPPDQNHLTFDFFGTSLRNPEKVTYQYTLQNFDRDWQPITKNNSAVYTNLQPGKYVFKVRASNNDGIWNRQAATINFEITPPFWRTWWFFTAVLLTLGGAGRLYYNLRVQQKLRSLIQVEKLKNEEIVKVRRRVAEDFHDQVGNQLASITVLVQLIQAKLPSGNVQVEELLTKLGQFTKTLFTGTRDFIWSIDPKSDQVNEMLIYIRDFGEELFEYSEVDFHVETNNAFDAKLKLPVGWSRHVVFIFKEALTNSLKHARCKNVYLSFNVSDRNFVFELRDDGIGLNGYKEIEPNGMGLRNMKERAKKIGGEIVIASDEGLGTVITLEGKIPQNEG